MCKSRGSSERQNDQVESGEATKAEKRPAQSVTARVEMINEIKTTTNRNRRRTGRNQMGQVLITTERIQCYGCAGTYEQLFEKMIGC